MPPPPPSLPLPHPPPLPAAELKYPTAAEVVAMRTTFYSRNHFVDAVLRVVLEEAGSRKVVFSTFDPSVACLLRLKQPRYPVFFLTCGGAKHFSDPRMNRWGQGWGLRDSLPAWQL